MSRNLIEAMKGKLFKQGRYTISKDSLDTMLFKGRCLVLFDELMESMITSPLVYWEFKDDLSWGIVVTRNSVYEVFPQAI